MNTTRPASRPSSLIVVRLLCLVLADTDAGKRAKKDTAVRAADLEAALTQLLPRPAGPRRTIAVMKSTSRSDFLARYGFSDVGGGLTASSS